MGEKTEGVVTKRPFILGFFLEQTLSFPDKKAGK